MISSIFFPYQKMTLPFPDWFGVPSVVDAAARSMRLASAPMYV